MLLPALLLCGVLPLLAQTAPVRGVVRDSKTLEPVSGANVVVRRGAGNGIVAYTATADDGAFSLQVAEDSLSAFVVQVSCLGYERQEFSLSPGRRDFTVKLEEKSFELREVAVKADKIIRSQDTTSYFVAGFATAKDRTIGDVLTNMPGISVAGDGKISYNGEPVNKFYIEGIDLFGGKYNIATNNISYGDIARVEVIENHQAVKALRGTNLGTETAINLKLKDGAKSSWGGNVSGKGGFSPDEGLWEAGLFAARFSPESQSASTLKSNNSGKDIAGEGKSLTIDDLLYMYPGNSISPNLKSAPSTSADLGSDRSRFNRTHIFSNSSMWKLSESAQIKSQVIYTDDKNTYDQGVATSYFLGDSVLVKGTDEASSVRDRLLEASVTATADKESYYLSDELSFKAGWHTYASGISGDFSYRSVADINTCHAENRLKYIRKAGNDIFQVMSLNTYTHIPEELEAVGQPDKRQKVVKGNFFTNTNFKYAHALGRWSLGADLDVYGNVYDFESRYADADDEYRGDLHVSHWGARLNPEAIYRDETFRLDLRLPFSAYRFKGELPETKLYVKPEVYLKWKFLSRWTLFANASAGNSFPGNDLFYTVPVMTDYRSMRAGFLSYDGRSEKRFGGRLGYADPSEMLFVNLSATYSDENTKRSISKQVDDGCVYYAYKPGDDKYKLWFADGNVSKGVDFLDGTVELKVSWQNHDMPIEQNGRTAAFDVGNVNAGLSVKSSPLDWMDIEYGAGFRYDYLTSDLLNSSSRHLTQKCLSTFYPTEDMSIKLNGEHYLRTSGAGSRKNTFLVDAEITYRHGQFDFIASATNLLDSRRYSYTVYGDLSNTDTRYKIRGRNILIGLNWYF